jgi:hypothetical protein
VVLNGVDFRIDGSPARPHLSNMFSFTVRGRRAGRIAFGAVLIAGMVLLIERLLLAREDASHAALVMAGTWAAALAAYAAVGWRASRRELAHADELAVPGLVLPSIGVALMYPLALHLPVALLLGGASGFDAWARFALVITGPTHLVLALLAAHRADQIVRGAPGMKPTTIYWICVAVSCVPFAILFMIPPLLVALTGLPAVGLMDWGERIADAERGAVCPVPRAIVVAAPGA